MTITYLLGDTREQVATIPDGSVSLVACSPPFIALRSYLPADHPMKSAEIGSEPDPATFIDTLLALTAEWGRVLAPWGSIAIELGDTYSAGIQPERQWPGLGDGKHEDREGTKHLESIDVAARTGAWPRPKCLALVPQAYALSLAYGRNVLNGNPSPAGQWLVRNMIVWHRPNPAVGALGDKFRPSTSYITVATRSAKRWFDLTAVRHAQTEPDRVYRNTDRKVHLAPHREGAAINTNPAGAPPLDAWFDVYDAESGRFDEHDTWTMTTQPSSLAHYAMWPAKLAERLVLSMCPEWVCGECGEPRRRVESSTYTPHGDVEQQHAENRAQRGATERGVNGTAQQFANGRATKNVETLGWTDCGHDAYRPGVVLDPFGGTGTTNAVAELHGRDSIWIDLDERNRALVPQRMAEVSRSLFGTKPELPGQEALFG